MRCLSDLHTHSTASDGQYTPSELVALAKSKGIRALALTDHDTVDGLAEAVRAGEALGVRVIRGIELSASEYRTFHILGYRVDPEAPGLSALCREMKEGRDRRSLRIIAFLREQGVDIPLAEVEALAGGDIVGRPHFAQVMVRHGCVSSSREAFDRYLDTEAFHRRAERPKPPARSCIRTIHEAGGIASLAHPYQIGIGDAALEALVRELAGEGLDAIECRYPRYTPEQQAFYLHLAEKYGLRITGGSDFHGERVKPDVPMTGYDLDISGLTATDRMPEDR